LQQYYIKERETKKKVSIKKGYCQISIVKKKKIKSQVVYSTAT
jgi:hypothetical protein